jgi:Protein of unknown function (DUF3443)
VRKKLWVSILLGSLGLVVGCGGGSSSSNSGSSGTNPTPPTSSTANALSITIDGGLSALAGGAPYTNGVFASATICVPGSTSSCTTVDHLLVDTGSMGLRVLESAISSLNLPAVDASNGSPAYNCVSFVDGSFLWGPVQGATVTLGKETASNVPIQVISTSTTNIPSSCSNNDLTEDENTQSGLGANGILGVGLEPTDCGLVCASGATPPDAYYTCSSLPCTPEFISQANQVTNPVVKFPKDNNGVIVELPKLSGSAATVNGSLIFGIGTESNNQLSSSATVFTLVCDAFNTIFNGQNLDVTNTPNNPCQGGSFIDSGSNGLFFPDTSIPVCSSNTPIGDLSSFYCPASSLSLSATNQDPNNTSTTKNTSFTVDNALNLFTASPGDAAFSNLGGLNPPGFGFDWGVPFFYGVNVYSAIDGQSMPSGAPDGPWWAY